MELCRICKKDTWQALLKYPLRTLKTMSNVDVWNICLDCMIEHCTSVNCLGCSYGEISGLQILRREKTSYELF